MSAEPTSELQAITRALAADDIGVDPADIDLDELGDGRYRAQASAWLAARDAAADWILSGHGQRNRRVASAWPVDPPATGPPVAGRFIVPRDLLEAFLDPDLCDYYRDEDGPNAAYCHAHGFTVDSGELCPQTRLKALLETGEEPG